MTDHIEKVNLNVEWCPTDDMVGDFMTKPHQERKCKEFRDKILGGGSQSLTWYNVKC